MDAYMYNLAIMCRTISLANPQNFSPRFVYIVSRVDNKRREESIEHAILPVQDVFGKSHNTRNSNIDQSECLIQIANSGCGLKCSLTRAR